ncbi:hypothetical protein LEP1GSC051_1915 [Leptospira sp. P2653]|nr:hypothetical protein LEP1GSC051_1915 [Leptospira sp. P2653]
MLSFFNAPYLATLRERDLSLGSVVPEFPLFLGGDDELC